MMDRPFPPRSIHDPITPEQAQYLPAFFWNVQTVVLTAQERQRLHNNNCAKARYQREKAQRIAAEDEAAWADEKVAQLTHIEPQNRPAHVPRPSTRRSKA